MATVVNSKLDLSVGALISCKYPLHGNRNVLKNRVGKIEKHGVSREGNEFITVQLLDGSYRTLSLSRVVDAVNA